MEPAEIIEAVATLNGEIYDITSSEEAPQFDFRTNGLDNCVKFLGVWLWSDNGDDRRVVNEETDEREPLVDFLRQKAIFEISRMNAVGTEWIKRMVAPVATPEDQQARLLKMATAIMDSPEGMNAIGAILARMHPPDAKIGEDMFMPPRFIAPKED